MAKEDRKQQIIEAAISVFARQGYYKTTTALIAEAVGVTQPYVFHFFKTKEELFIAVLQQSVRRIASVFKEVEAPPEQLMDRMGEAFNQLLLSHRDETMLSMQSFTVPEPAIRQQSRDGFAFIHHVVQDKFEKAWLPQPAASAASFIGLGLATILAEVLELRELMPDC
ncbi:TetR/AcrR family transcriptional regulator [Paenibacillus ginsengarvi]|uniref:TetR/AcrR family transcriptional regulator n=1 Tax=Paenibacillus ginsengarvi TaxID=400777 RepID=A0A3B0C3G9_9BACL|nr:TetR/AcrR family transcriptional regulator [Paenibacillus ginsengarvi]RKN79078.1 TetR/AcrR family transcriptional regulator [Paenibacillus ginsengarvi]